MKIPVTPRRLFAAAFAVLLAVNSIILYGVAANRSGEPEAQLTLTERELQLPYRSHKENSGLHLRLQWRVAGGESAKPYLYRRTAPWLDAQKLEELGFDTSPVSEERGDRLMPLAREVFILLEYDGPAYKHALEEAERAAEEAEAAYAERPQDKREQAAMEQARKALQRERTSSSRLFAVDVSLDTESLREAQPDRSRYLVARGVVRAFYLKEQQGKRYRVTGQITQLSIDTLHVPLRQKRFFDTLPGQTDPRAVQPPRYRVSVAYGKRFEPWIVSVGKLTGGGAGL